jgi:hypothetical protein
LLAVVFCKGLACCCILQKAGVLLYIANDGGCRVMAVALWCDGCGLRREQGWWRWAEAPAGVVIDVG